MTRANAYLLLALLIVIGAGVEILYPWFPTIGMVVVLAFLIGLGVTRRQKK